MKSKANRQKKLTESELGFAFFNEIGIIAQLSGTQFARTLPEGLSRSQFRILNWFTRVDVQATPGRLARAMEVSKGAMTYTLKKLETKELVTVTPDDRSGRQKIVTMTKKGANMRLRAVSAMQPILELALDEIGVKKLKKTLPFLEEVRKYLDANR